ncbi:hypothetical protein PAXRUDRAFT_827065 [Paxillus rubicundulus Ve08.2h10]|uniref:Uncharacterized protein n=1 Tax=Paxillus rubicundulus Ve08.2h10 TaxID=930991 RepID=A0A0D0E905_9AGAM|nr:hypothetical protein PAXRUDRAFT_827065 [Paxillus rubicundulus Ve08.2h10]
MAISTQTVSQSLVANYPDVWMSNHSSILFFLAKSVYQERAQRPTSSTSSCWSSPTEPRHSV